MSIRYIYGFPIDYELFELYESYMAADKYLLHRFGKAFSDYVKSKLNAENSCLIYQQLVKIENRENIPLAEVRTLIMENSWAIFESEHFRQTDQETLISLLSLDVLSIDEFDLLVAVSKWVDCEVQRQGLPVNGENRQKVFEPIKGYVLFTALTLEKAAKCNEIAKLLTLEEAVLLLNPGEPLMIKQKTSRRAAAASCSVFVRDLFPVIGRHGYRRVIFSVNRRVRIRAIYLTYSQSATNLSFQVENITPGAYLNLRTKISKKDGKLCLLLSPPWDVQQNHQCRVLVVCTSEGTLRSEHQFTSDVNLSYGSITFDFNQIGPNHFVRGLAFVPLD